MEYGYCGTASPGQANQTSPGCGLIEQVENLLFRCARPHQIENVLVGEVHNLCYALSYVSRRFRLPLAQPGVQPLHQHIHGSLLPHIQFSYWSPMWPTTERPAASVATFQVATSASLPTFLEECRYEYRHGRRNARSTCTREPSGFARPGPAVAVKRSAWAPAPGPPPLPWTSRSAASCRRSARS